MRRIAAGSAVLALAAISLCAFTCRGSAAPREEATVPEPAVRFETSRGTWAVKIEIARTEQEMQRGLMYRTKLDQDRGMLFLFAVPEVHAFWMHNTLIPLDMIFLGEDRAVVGIVANAAPQTDTLRRVNNPSKYVLEVGGGEAAAHGVVPGTRAVFLAVPE
jgi:uncharacterized membrane protein (UPF0127 family)